MKYLIEHLGGKTIEEFSNEQDFNEWLDTRSNMDMDNITITNILENLHFRRNLTQVEMSPLVKNIFDDVLRYEIDESDDEIIVYIEVNDGTHYTLDQYEGVLTINKGSQLDVEPHYFDREDTLKIMTMFDGVYLYSE